MWYLLDALWLAGLETDKSAIKKPANNMHFYISTTI